LARDRTTTEKAAKAFVDGFRKEISHEITVRNASLVRAAKRAKPCICEVCGFDFAKVYGNIGRDFIEGHHRRPVADYGKAGKRITVKEIILVCPNCHRMLHRGVRIVDWRKLKRLVADLRRKEARA
jgi:putative restriction endonuclease